ncbi:PPP4R2-domain-containing protein [Gymnopilus junonius]|uniref:PPP4R2-domain-containing protein n=1 Tax=Gymnopilus junonius TaxID=109634 RepID=A0A9P5TUA5_GYMJU|nr:PPP4R2-domain-containing protein [Gymnopilus junonius]
MTLTEDDALLQKVASDDALDQNRKGGLTVLPPPLPAPYTQINTPAGGLKLPPFLPRKVSQIGGVEVLKSYMNEEEAKTMKENIFAQLDQFEGSPPFTIQRLCELCLEPKRQYKSIGKYLRAVEKSILVTSTWDSFPPLTPSEIHSAGRSAILLGSTLQSAPSTPLFSPIPFLHDDARRSKSRSPPPTPLSLNSGLPITEEPITEEDVKPVIGLVDELDDPSPGHMSDHPTALTAVTTSPQSRPFMGSLDDRFVKSEDEMDTSSDSMEMDEDKENKQGE